jgi:hypothetical protein
LAGLPDSAFVWRVGGFCSIMDHSNPPDRRKTGPLPRGGDVATETKTAASTGSKTAKTVTIKKGARITGAARDKLAADLRKKYEKGQSIRALAEGTGRSYGFVHRLLLDAEVPLRGRGGATRTKKK